MVPLDGSIGVLIGMWDVAEGNDPVRCNNMKQLELFIGIAYYEGHQVFRPAFSLMH